MQNDPQPTNSEPYVLPPPPTEDRSGSCCQAIAGMVGTGSILGIIGLTWLVRFLFRAVKARS